MHFTSNEPLFAKVNRIAFQKRPKSHQNAFIFRNTCLCNLNAENILNIYNTYTYIQNTNGNMSPIRLTVAQFQTYTHKSKGLLPKNGTARLRPRRQPASLPCSCSQPELFEWRKQLTELRCVVCDLHRRRRSLRTLVAKRTIDTPTREQQTTHAMRQTTNK